MTKRLMCHSLILILSEFFDDPNLGRHIRIRSLTVETTEYKIASSEPATARFNLQNPQIASGPHLRDSRLDTFDHLICLNQLDTSVIKRTRIQEAGMAIDPFLENRVFGSMGPPFSP